MVLDGFPYQWLHDCVWCIIFPIFLYRLADKMGNGKYRMKPRGLIVYFRGFSEPPPPLDERRRPVPPLVPLLVTILFTMGRSSRSRRTRGSPLPTFGKRSQIYSFATPGAHCQLEVSAAFVESTLRRIEPRLDRAAPVLGQRSCQGLSRCRQVSPRCRRSVAARRSASPNGPSVAKVSPSVAKCRQVSPSVAQVSPSVAKVSPKCRQVSPTKCRQVSPNH